MASYLNEDPESYCLRCKIKPADFICKACDPFRLFCSNCDGYVHSLPSKRNHSRQLIDQPEPPHQSTLHNTRKHPSVDLSYSNTNVFGSYPNNNTISPKNSNVNYINEIRKMYDYEKEELTNKSISLQRELDHTKMTVNNHITSLEFQMEEMQRKHNNEIDMIKDEHNIEVRRIVTEKDNEIRNLFHKISELERSNDDLMYKLNEYVRVIDRNSEDNENKLSSAEYEINKLNKELKDMKNYYEKRLAYLTDSFTEEKGKLINSYEKNFEKLNSGYLESKEKFISLIRQKEEDMRELTDKFRNEEMLQEKEKVKLREEVCDLKNQLSESMKQVNLYKIDIDNLKENYDKLKKESKAHIKEKKKLEQESQNITKELEIIKSKHEKLHRITHGKFK